jgi:hypothetical protein
MTLEQAAAPRPSSSTLRMADGDATLPALASLLDADRVRSRAEAGGLWEQPPESIGLSSFSHWPGSRAVAVYELRWPTDAWLGTEQLCVEARAGEVEPLLYYYRDDPHLPGLSALTDPEIEHQLLDRYVGVHPHRVAVSLVRYRATQRAVLELEMWWRQGSVRKLGMYARAMRPSRLADWFAARDVMLASGYNVPSVLGAWPEGGAVWLETMQGQTLRQLIRARRAPPPEAVLEGMSPLWRSQATVGGARSLSIDSAARYTTNLIQTWMPDVAAGPEQRDLFASVLAFARSWQPSGPAHNDFHDGQLIIQPNGRIGVVDFDEAGPGDALIDVANLLAHLRWMAAFGPGKAANEEYRRRLRVAARDHFGPDADGLAIREAFALVRLASNPLRQARDDYATRVRDGLSLAWTALRQAE